MRWSLLLLVFAACSGSTPSYTFPGCEDAGDGSDPSCSDANVFSCAEAKLQQQYGTCTDDSDCAIVNVNGSCAPSCGAFVVRADSAGVFTDSFSNEAAKFCKVQQSNGSCGGEAFGDGVNCGANECDVAACVNGTCAAVPPSDGGGPCGG